MKHIAIMVAVPEPSPSHQSVEELVERIQVSVPRGLTVDHVIELTDALHSVLTRTRSANLVTRLASAFNKGLSKLQAVR